VFDISDDARNDYAVDDNGNRIVDHEHINRSRLRVDTRKWYASKVLPKIYGDKLISEVTGKDGGAIKVEDTTRANTLAEIMAALKRKET
jgi:hypothetical protein